MYELGIRHGVKPFVTLLLCRRGTRLPFNVHGVKALHYDPPNKKTYEDTKDEIIQLIGNGLQFRETDSPVHLLIDMACAGKADRLERTQVYKYDLLEASEHQKRQIRLITGDIQNVREVDIWVNSENTEMQMARFYDRSISGVIRYYGAKRNTKGEVTKDIVEDELRVVRESSGSFKPGQVIVTGPGQLKRSNGVKKIFHAASVAGQVGRGYRPIGNIGDCVRNALREAERFRTCHSILFPLLGTGTAAGPFMDTVDTLVDTAIAYLQRNDGTTVIREVYFLAWTDRDLETCQAVLDARDDVGDLIPPPRRKK
jgi:O-acetyl-ADP-ribose deacetylase (regulator of RNase III)